MVDSWYFRGAVLAWIAGVDLLLVVVICLCVWLLIGNRRLRMNTERLAVGRTFIRLKG